MKCDFKIGRGRSHGHLIYILDLGGRTTPLSSPKARLTSITANSGRPFKWIVERHFHCPLRASEPAALPTARGSTIIVYYGEKPTKKLLRLIEKAVGEKGLQFAYDDHEMRLELDVEAFISLCITPAE